MNTVLIIIGAGILLLAVLIGRAVSWSSPRGNPYDVERMRQEVLDSAADEEELEYLKELNSLDLHRRHLVC